MLRVQAQTDWPALPDRFYALRKVPQEGPRMGCYSEPCKLMEFRTRLFDVKWSVDIITCLVSCSGFQKFHTCSWFVTVLSCWLPDVTNRIDSTVPVLLPFVFFEVSIVWATSPSCPCLILRLRRTVRLPIADWTVHYRIMLMVMIPLHVLYVIG